MSMFNRSVKLQFNRMKYSNLKLTAPFSSRILVRPWEVLFSRTFFLTLGFCSMAGLMNFDINKYKLMKGVLRWKHRVEAFLGFPHKHGHEHGLIGLEGDHGNEGHGEHEKSHHTGGHH